MRHPFAGFTMVEVLVAVLLLAVGLVGALAMQAHAMRSRQIGRASCRDRVL